MSPSHNELDTPIRRNTSQLESNADMSDSQQNPKSSVRLDEAGQDQPSISPAQRTGTTATFQAGITRRMTTLFEPEKKLVNVPSYAASFKHAFLSSYINILLVFIPISWGAHFGGLSDTLIFIFSFLAIIPLASLLSFATEELALRVGQTLGGLLNATLGNAVELIVAILALIKCELQIVQSSLIGSILSNILLVLGMCFVAGGTKFAEQEVMSMAAQLNASLLYMAVIAILIPAAFHVAVSSPFNTNVDNLLERKLEDSDILAMSRGVAIILIFIYISYLVFQLFSHAHLYVDPTGPTTSTQYPDSVKNRFGRKKSIEPSDTHGSNASEVGSQHEGGGEEEPQLNFPTTIFLLVLSTVLVGVTAEWLVASINGLTEAHPALSNEFVGLILLPIVGNAAEHVTAVTVARKDKLDLSMGVAIGSSIQISLFVIPCLTILAWCIGKPLSMLFDPFESIVLFLSVLLVNSTLSDSRSNWLEGVLLMSVYVLLAVSFWYYPGQLPVIACT